MHKLESQASQLILKAEGYGESRLDIDILKQKKHWKVDVKKSSISYTAYVNVRAHFWWPPLLIRILQSVIVAVWEMSYKCIAL